MTRPKKGTKGAEEATQKWRETMQQKYGGAAGVHNMMRIIGAKGGRNGRGPNYKGGFAANHELARICGAIGGRKSSRRGIQNGQGKKALRDIEDIEATIRALEGEGDGRD